MLDLLDLRHLFDQAVIKASNRVHEFAFPACGLDGAHDLIALFPLLQKAWNHFNRILEITAHADGTVPRGLAKPIVGRIELTEIFRIENGADFFVFRANATQKRAGTIRRAVINKQNLIIIL